jgi:hypothetical protein
MDLFDDLPDAPIEVVPKAPLTRAQKVDAELDRVQEEILQESLGVIEGALKFADIEPSEVQGPPPKEWVERYGYEKAKKVQRLAGYGLMPKKDAPAGLSLASATASSILNARAKSGEGPRVLNVQVVQISSPLPTFEVVEVDK